jgi:hypothetical protein
MGQPGTHHATISARCWRHFFFWATRRIFGPSRRCRRASPSLSSQFVAALHGKRVNGSVFVLNSWGRVRPGCLCEGARMRSAMLRTLHAKVREGGRGTWDHLLLGLVYVRWVFQNGVRLWYS